MFFLDLEFFGLFLGEGVVDEEDQGHDAEHDGGDEGAKVVHDFKVAEGLDGTLFIFVMHAEECAVDADRGDNLTDFAEQVEDGVGCAVVAASGLDFDIIDRVRDHCPQLHNEGRQTDAADKVHQKEDPHQDRRIHAAKEEQNQVCAGGERHADLGDFLLTLLAGQLRKEEHEDQHRGVGAGLRRKVHPVCVEVIVKQVGVEALSKHLTGKEQHRNHRDRDKRTVLKQQLERFLSRTLLRKLRLGLNTFLIQQERDDEHNKRADRHDDNALDNRSVLHVGDNLAVLTDDRIAGGIKTVSVSKARNQEDWNRTKRRADRTPDRKTAALMSVRCNNRCKRTVRNLKHRVGHAKENVGAGRVNAGRNIVAFLTDAREFQEHQHSGKRQERRRVKDPLTVTAELAGFHRIRDTAHDRVVDPVPNPRDNKHDHNKQRAQMENVGVELLEKGSNQRKDKTPGGIDHGIAGVVFQLKSAGPFNVGLVLI